VPRGDEVERRVGRLEVAAVEHPNQAVTLDEQVAGDEVGVAHDVGVLAWELPES